MDLAETRRPQKKIDVGPPISIIVPGKETRPLDVGERSSPSVQAVVLQPGSDFSLPVVGQLCRLWQATPQGGLDRKSTRLNSSHVKISYAVFCLKKKKKRSEHKTPCR